MPTILLLRHAQASFGGEDYDVLSEVGHRQVQKVYAALQARGVRADRLASGALRRQLDTAAAFGEPQVDPRWNECDTTDLLGAHSTSPARQERPADDAEVPPLSSREFQSVLDDGMHAWIAAGADSPADEPWPAFRGRVAEALAETAGSLDKGETALVVTSAGVIAACALITLELPDATLATFNRVSVNTSVTKLIHGRRGTSLVSFNDHAHLEGAARDLLTYR